MQQKLILWSGLDEMFLGTYRQYRHHINTTAVDAADLLEMESVGVAASEELIRSSPKITSRRRLQDKGN